jgi:hypothetical protein
MRSQVSDKAGGFPELVVEDSPAPADVAVACSIQHPTPEPGTRELSAANLRVG